MHAHSQRKRRPVAAFSLIEVCLALGLIVFCLVALLALLQGGLQHERLSTDRVRAAHILSAIVDDLRGAGRATGSAVPSALLATPRYALPFPAAGSEAKEKIFAVDESARITAPGEGDYVIYCRIEPPAADQGIFEPSRARLLIAWPAQARLTGGGKPKLEHARGSEEVIVEIGRG